MKKNGASEAVNNLFLFDDFRAQHMQMIAAAKKKATDIITANSAYLHKSGQKDI